jgi:hypothetical protein
MLCLPEDSQTVLCLLSAIYPSSTSLGDMSLEKVAPLTAKARRNSFNRAAKLLSGEYKRLTTGESAYKPYAIVDVYCLPDEAKYAACLTFSFPMAI